MRGRKPLPDAIAKMRGTKRRPHLRGRKIVLPIASPDMPASIRSDEDALECWKRMTKQLKELKVLTRADQFALEGLCLAYSRACQADRIVAEHGLIVKTFKGVGPNPAIKISKDAWSELRRFAGEFGLTPSSRARVRPVSNDDEEETTKTSGKSTPARAKANAEDFIFGGLKLAK